MQKKIILEREITNKKIEMIKRSKKLSEIIQLDEFETSNMNTNNTTRINSKSKENCIDSFLKYSDFFSIKNSL